MTSQRELRLPWLVQRIKRNEHPIEKASGIDRVLSFDYMGSAEFEWGNLPRTFAVMRERDERSTWPEPSRLAFGEHRLWFFGPPEAKPIAIAFVQDQLGERKHHTKEATYLKAALVGEPGREWAREYIGWWAILDGPPVPGAAPRGTPFVLFREERDVMAWVNAQRAPA